MLAHVLVSLCLFKFVCAIVCGVGTLLISVLTIMVIMMWNMVFVVLLLCVWCGCCGCVVNMLMLWLLVVHYVDGVYVCASVIVCFVY